MSKKQGAIDSVHVTWNRIETWLDTHAPSMKECLHKGATQRQFQKLESHLKLTLPKDFKESYAIHDGQDDCDFIPDDYGSFYLLPLQDIPAEWDLWNDMVESGEFEDLSTRPGKGVVAGWWNAGWVPFASDGGGDFLCVDLAPADGGTIGQVIKMQHDSDERPVVAASFAAWLQQLAEAFENGELEPFLEE